MDFLIGFDPTVSEHVSEGVLRNKEMVFGPLAEKPEVPLRSASWISVSREYIEYCSQYPPWFTVSMGLVFVRVTVDTEIQPVSN